jgi:hypothetical protein
VNQIVIVVGVILTLIAGLGLSAYIVYKGKLRRAKAIERGLKMVPLLIHLPPPTSDTAAGTRDVREVMREKTAQAEVLYNLIAGTATEGFKSKFYGQRHIALEIIATDGLIHYYAAVPVNMVEVVKNAIISSYSGARVEEAEDHNIFSKQGKLFGTMGGEMILKAESSYPIANYTQMERDPMEAILTAMGGITPGNGAGIQIMLRPADKSWIKRSEKISRKKRRVRQSNSMEFGVKDLAKAAVKAPSQSHSENKPELSNLELSVIEAVENKTKSTGFEVLIRIVVSTESVSSSQALLQKLATSFALFEQPGLNGFKFLPTQNSQGLVTAFILRFFPPALKDMVLNTEELATLFHIPDSQFIASTGVERLQAKQVDGPISIPAKGLLLGFNEFRGVKKEIRLSDEDRRRHTYIIGQTGTGKSVMLENMVKQDLINGNGFAFIDPHGETAEKLLGLIPKERAEDVIYFDPGNTEDPLGLNLFEFTDPAQKDFLIQESLSMLIKIYDPDGQGIIGPRFEQWYRNAALTLMSDPNGSTFIEIPKVFTDTEYLKNKFKYLKDPTVIEFWTKEMGQTSEYHKSEMLGFFVSKFGAFQQNEIMRNIIGQTESSFNMREIMDKKKILIVNLSKGKIGELNSKLLGMMFVIKFQAAAMSRANMAESERNDFCLYVDEFQNFSTDSFASILSEARKYRLNIIVANQFIGQLTPEIRDAVFGNVGTIISHRVGPEDAEFMTKQFAPIFDARDLVNIPNLNSVAKVLVGGLPSQPFSMVDLPFVTGVNKELAEAMKELSSAKYGRPRAQVEADIAARLSNKPVPSLTPPTPAPIPAPALISEQSVAPTTISAPQPAPVADTVSVPAPPVDNTLNIAALKRPASADVPAVPLLANPAALPGSAKISDEMAAEAQDEIDSLLGMSLLNKDGEAASVNPAALAKPEEITPEPLVLPVIAEVIASVPADIALVPLEVAPDIAEVATPAIETVAPEAPVAEKMAEHSKEEMKIAEAVVETPVEAPKAEVEKEILEAPKGPIDEIPAVEAVIETPPEIEAVIKPQKIEEPVEPTELPEATVLGSGKSASLFSAETPALLEPIVEPIVQAELVTEEAKPEPEIEEEAAPVPMPAELAAAVSEIAPSAVEAPSTASEAAVIEPSDDIAAALKDMGGVVNTAPAVPGAVVTPEAHDTPAAPVEAVDPAIANLAPGEIYVDDNGIVHQG